jgi:hypothetical protein
MKETHQKMIVRGSLAVLLLSSVAACSGRSSAGLAAGDGAAVAANGSSGTSGTAASGSGSSGSGTDGSSANGSASAGTDGSSSGPTVATGPQGAPGPQGPAGVQGVPGTPATLLGGALGGAASVNAGGLQVGGAGSNGSTGTVAVSALGPAGAPNAPVSASVLSGPGNQVQGLLTGVTTTVSNPTTLGNSVLATTQPLLGASGTLPVVSQVTSGLLPTAPAGSVPLVGATLGQTALLGNGTTPSVVNAAIVSPTAASGSPVTANVLSGGSGAALVGGGGSALGGVTSVVGGVTGAPAAAGAPATNLVGGATTARPVQGLVGGTLNTVGGVLGNTTGGLLRR